MLRKQTRRSFTVETKHGANQGRTFITAKVPRVPWEAARSIPTVLSSVFEPAPVAPAPTEAMKGIKPRRILPSLITWEPSELEAAPSLPSEPSLPRVRRVGPSVPPEAPRRRGRPRKVTLEAVDAAPVILEAEPLAPVSVLASPSTVRPVWGDRSKTAGLPRGERWKRRLPRACW